MRMPIDFAKNIVGGKSYELSRGKEERVWRECLATAARMRSVVADDLMSDLGAVLPEWGG